MDPLSIASAVVMFWEAAVRLKTSIDKVAKIRQRTREITEDVFSHIITVKDFCDTNAAILQSDTLVELKSSLEALQLKLLRICEICERITPRRTSGRLRRLSAGYALWRQSDEIEADLLRLKESLQVWVNRTQLISAARSEVAIARVENDTLVSLQDSRSHIRQFDDIFCQMVSDPSSQYLHIQVTSINGLDDAWKGYVRLKMSAICDVLKEKPRLVSIPPGTFAAVMPKEMLLSGISIRKQCPNVQLSGLVRRLSYAWQLLFTESSFDLPMLSIPDLFSDLSRFGVGNLVSSCFQSFARDLRHTLQSPLNTVFRKELLFWLDYSAYQQWLSNPEILRDPNALEIVEDHLAVCRQLRLLCSTNDEVLQSRVYLSQALRAYAALTYLNGDTAAALTYTQEYLETAMPTYHLAHPFPSICPLDSMEGIHDNPLLTATLRRLGLISLCEAAIIHSKVGDYSRACRLGRDAVFLITDLRLFANILPSEFDFLDAQYSFLQRAIPTWITVPRNPSTARVEEIDAEDEPGDPESRRVIRIHDQF